MSETNTQITITLKDNVLKEYPAGVTSAEIARDIGAGLYKSACAALVNGEPADLRDEITADASVEIITSADPEGLQAYWHTASHIMAQAVKRLYPEARLAIGPAIAEGFYYDIDTPQPITADDLPRIEDEMKKIIKENLELTRRAMPRDEAIAWAKNAGEPYKAELIRELPPEAGSPTFYTQGEFTDLCRGPHLMSTGCVKAFKLLSVAGAYWRGDAKNKMMTRIYGIAYPKAQMVEDYITRIEEAKKRDHRKLGAQLELFTIVAESPGFVIFLPNGMTVKNELIRYWHEIHAKAGYLEIQTPVMLDMELWERSGHLAHYHENMYRSVIDERDFAIKPMNCPGGMLAYSSRPRSYRDLPLRMGELGLVHRHEPSGVLHGLMRARCFTQDDAHIFMTPEQTKSEIKRVVSLVDEVYRTFGFTYNVELSTRPEKSMGTDEDWERATAALKEALEELRQEYKINHGDGAFYGPKIDFHLQDSIGRTWQCATIQLDMQMPERFELEYTAPDGAKKRPVMIHRTVFGSIERFIGVITEHFAGAFPVWLSPVQAKVLPISEKYTEYAEKVREALAAAGIRVQADLRPEKIGYKIREARNLRVPYILVAGEQEAAAGTVSVRTRAGDEGQAALGEITARIAEEIKDRK